MLRCRCSPYAICCMVILRPFCNQPRNTSLLILLIIFFKLDDGHIVKQCGLSPSMCLSTSLRSQLTSQHLTQHCMLLQEAVLVWLSCAGPASLAPAVQRQGPNKRSHQRHHSAPQRRLAHCFCACAGAVSNLLGLRPVLTSMTNQQHTGECRI